MGGPIVRTGTTPAFWENWEKAFGKAARAGKKSGAKVKAKPAKSSKSKATGKGKKKKK